MVVNGAERAEIAAMQRVAKPMREPGQDAHQGSRIE